MRQRAAPDTAVERLARHLLERSTDEALAEEVAGWLAGSARFRAFVEGHRDKIRKKLRTATDADARRDVRAELRVAHLLLADRRIDLAFEAYGAGKVGPDFTVAFRGERSFNLEVTRLRGGTALVRPLLAKLRQLPPSAPNAVLVAIEGVEAGAIDVGTATRALRARADAKDEEFFVRGGFEGARAFYQRFLRLGAVLVWSEGADGDARAALWSNPSARIPLPERAVRACLLSVRAG